MMPTQAPTARVVYIIGLCLCTGIAASAGEQAAAMEPPDFAKVVAAMLEAAAELTPPAPPEVTGPITVGTLAMDAIPESELLAGYAHVWTASGVYARPEGHPALVCEVHHFASDLDAFGPFSAQRPSGAEEAPAILSSAYWVGTHLRIWRGAYCIHMFSRPDPVDADAQQEARVAIGKLATALLKAFPIPERLPPLLQIVPLSGRHVGSPQLHRVQLAEGAGMVDCIRVTLLETHESNCVLTVYGASDAEGAARVFEEWVDSAAAKAGEGAIELPLIAERAAFIANPDATIDGCVLQDDYAAVVEGCRTREFAEAVLMIVSSHIRILVTTGDLSGRR